MSENWDSPADDWAESFWIVPAIHFRLVYGPVRRAIGIDPIAAIRCE